MIHLTIQQLSSYLDAEASESSRSVVQDHLAVCDTCSAKFARLKRQEESLVKALSSDPGDAFFDEFHRSLAERVAPRPSKAESAPFATPALGARPAGSNRAGVQAARPVAARPVAPRSVSVPPVAARSAGVPPVTAREILRDRDSAGREAPDDFVRSTPKRAKESAFPWGAAVTIFVIVGSIGAVNFGAQYATQWLGASRSGDVRPMNGPGPVAATAGDGSFAGTGSSPDAGTPQAPVATPTPGAPAQDPAGTRWESTPAAPPARQAPPVPSASPPSAPAPADDSGPVWKPDSDETTESTLEDERPESAAKYDAIGMAIERSLPMLQGDDYRAARYNLAEARYNAWRLEPNSARSAVVLRAIRAYLIGAPTGPQRDTATGWLTEVESAGY